MQAIDKHIVNFPAGEIEREGLLSLVNNDIQYLGNMEAEPIAVLGFLWIIKQSLEEIAQDRVVIDIGQDSVKSAQKAEAIDADIARINHLENTFIDANNETETPVHTYLLSSYARLELAKYCTSLRNFDCYLNA